MYVLDGASNTCVLESVPWIVQPCKEPNIWDVLFLFTLGAMDETNFRTLVSDDGYRVRVRIHRTDLLRTV